MNIEIEHNPDQSRLIELGVFNWPVWEKEASTFPWTYYEEEISSILEGNQSLLPARPPAAQSEPEDAISQSDPWPGACPLEKGQLLAKDQILKR